MKKIIKITKIDFEKCNTYYSFFFLKVIQVNVKLLNLKYFTHLKTRTSHFEYSFYFMKIRDYNKKKMIYQPIIINIFINTSYIYNL